MTTTLPKPPLPTRLRTQAESFLVLRRNALELWGPPAYSEMILPGRFLGREQIMLNDPDAIRHVLVDNHENYRRNSGTERVLQPVLGRGLFLAEGKAWRHQRRTIAPSFTPRSMTMLAGHVVAASQAKEAALSRLTGKSLELLPHLQNLALTIAGQSMFSLEMAQFGAELRAMILRYALNYAQPGVLDFLLPATMRSPLDVGRARFRRDWLRLIDRILDARERQPQPEGAPRDLFDLLAAARDPETGEGFDRAQLRDEVATMILAGHETTAISLFWSLYIAARLPHEAAQIAAEAAGLDLSPCNAAAALKSLPRTRAFVDEALRLYPPAFLITREARAPDRVAGHRVAAGAVISIAPWVLHRHAAFWPRADEFDPARFLAGCPPPPRYAYMPFGAGPRVCVGAQFALTESVLVLAHLIQRMPGIRWRM